MNRCMPPPPPPLPWNQRPTWQPALRGTGRRQRKQPLGAVWGAAPWGAAPTTQPHVPGAAAPKRGPRPGPLRSWARRPGEPPAASPRPGRQATPARDLRPPQPTRQPHALNSARRRSHVTAFRASTTQGYDGEGAISQPGTTAHMPHPARVIRGNIEVAHQGQRGAREAGRQLLRHTLHGKTLGGAKAGVPPTHRMKIQLHEGRAAHPNTGHTQRGYVGERGWVRVPGGGGGCDELADSRRGEVGGTRGYEQRTTASKPPVARTVHTKSMGGRRRPASWPTTAAQRTSSTDERYSTA
jgi:hypothetical protein